jgi:uncharacterized protein
MLRGFGVNEGMARNFPIVSCSRAVQFLAMTDFILQVVAVAAIFIVAGCIKGVAGMGLPTVAIGLLGLLMPPAEAAAFLVIPSLVTNVWQFLAGTHRLVLLRRMWAMLLAIALATWACAGLIARAGTSNATAALGATLIAYAIVGLAKIRVSVTPRHEPWLSPIIGATTGIVTGATGVFVVPAVPYLQALDLDKDDLVQALGLSFTVSTVALAAGLTSAGVLYPHLAGMSVLCTVPALAGMMCGQAIRDRIDNATFRLAFFLGLLILGVELAVQSVI